MPTDQDDDVEISAILNQAEPPKSPKHVDAAILKYAREQAKETTLEKSSSSGWLSLSWLQQNWMPAAATLSIAAIAVSVSLQIFVEPDLQSSSKSASAELALSDSVATRQSAPATAVVEAEQQSRTSAALSSSLQDAASRSLTAQPLPERREPTVANQSLGTTAQVQSSAARTTSIAAQSSEEITETDELIEEALANTAAASSSVRSRSAFTQEPSPSFTEILADDVGLQEAVVSVLLSSLGVSEQTVVVAPQDFSLLINSLVEAYLQVPDTPLLREMQNRYSLARSEQSDSRLPESLAELVSLLEGLEN